jgi:hypothetical protein
MPLKPLPDGNEDAAQGLKLVDGPAAPAKINEQSGTLVM